MKSFTLEKVKVMAEKTGVSPLILCTLTYLYQSDTNSLGELQAEVAREIKETLNK